VPARRSEDLYQQFARAINDFRRVCEAGRAVDINAHPDDFRHPVGISADPQSDQWAFSGELYESFVEFASVAGEDRVTRKALSMELRKRGFGPRRLSGGCRGFNGIRLKLGGSTF
jgi:hypothetical protein